MKKQVTSILAILLTLTILVTGCGAPASTSSSTPLAAPSVSTSPSSLPAPESDEPVTATSIVSLAPSNTEILVALGLGDKLVAIDRHSDGLDGVAAGLPQFDIMKPDTETLIALDAGLIFTTGMSKAKGEDPYKPMRDAGCEIINIDTPKSIEEIKASIRLIGEAVGKSDDAEALVKELESELTAYAAIGSTITEKKSVFFEISAAPSLYSFGNGVYLNEMLTLLGAVNVLDDQQGWVSVSEEAVLAANPDVIFTNVDYTPDPIGEIKGRAGWTSINAVKNNQVYQISNNPSSLANQNIVIALREMAAAIYPEQYKALLAQ